MKPSRTSAPRKSDERPVRAGRIQPGLEIVVVCVMLITGLTTVRTASADTSIVLRTNFPIEGDRTELYVQGEDGNPINGAVVIATYRPGSSVENTIPVGETGESGRLVWTPATAGIVTLTATWESSAGDTVSTTENVSVKFRSSPVGGILIMLLAGLLLVGGSVVRIFRVLRSGE